jgi:hypothetical protein
MSRKATSSKKGLESVNEDRHVPLHEASRSGLAYAVHRNISELVRSGAASTYGNQGRWQEAAELELEVLQKRRKVLGEDHSDTLTSMADIASTWRYQER